MHDAANEQSNDEMARDYFKKPPSRARPLIGFKAPQALKDKLDAQLRLWQIRERVEADHKIATTKFKDAAEKQKLVDELEEGIKRIDFTYVCFRLMDLASDESLSESLKEVGFDHVPANEDEWSEIRATFLKNAKSSK